VEPGVEVVVWRVGVGGCRLVVRVGRRVPASMRDERTFGVPRLAA
jgi:hypothetical protein